MINKIKDFVKNKLPRFKRNRSDQSESFQPDGTGNFDLNREHKLTFKERVSSIISSIKDKYNGRRLKPLQVPQNGKEAAPGSAKQGLALLSPNMSRYIEQFLSRQYREPIHQAFLVTLICAVTYSVGKIAALGLKGTPVLDSARDYTVTIPFERDFNANTLNQVKSINIFRTNGGPGRKKNVADTKCEKSQGVSNLPIKLMNATVLQDSVKSLASVQVRGDRLLQEVREGDQISNLAKIFKIDRMEMLVKNLENGACESIVSNKLQDRGGRGNVSVMSPSESRNFLKNRQLPGIENTGNKFKIQKGLLDEKLKDIGNILTQARAIKIQNPDGSLSFKMTEMDPNGIFPYLGLQDQDIITSINGKPIYDMNEVMSLFARIKNLESLSLGIKREGSDSVQEYSIKK